MRSHREGLVLHFSSSPLLLLLLLLCLGNCSAVGIAKLPCNGSLAECDLEDDLEMLMESEISRRFLADGKTITYGALKKDRPAFGGGKGLPYLPKRPYNRGCSPIYGCRIDKP